MVIWYRITLAEYVVHVLPLDTVADLKPGVLDGAYHPVPRPCPTECGEVSARFQHPQTPGPHVDVVGDPGVIPRPTHEPQFVRRVRDDGVNRVVGQFAEHVKAVAVPQGYVVVLVVDYRLGLRLAFGDLHP
jgi:hypothetical protein